MSDERKRFFSRFSSAPKANPVPKQNVAIDRPRVSRVPSKEASARVRFMSMIAARASDAQPLVVSRDAVVPAVDPNDGARVVDFTVASLQKYATCNALTGGSKVAKVRARPNYDNRLRRLNMQDKARKRVGHLGYVDCKAFCRDVREVL